MKQLTEGHGQETHSERGVVKCEASSSGHHHSVDSKTPRKKYLKKPDALGKTSAIAQGTKQMWVGAFCPPCSRSSELHTGWRTGPSSFWGAGLLYRSQYEELPSAAQGHVGSWPPHPCQHREDGLGLGAQKGPSRQDTDCDQQGGDHPLHRGGPRACYFQPQEVREPHGTDSQARAKHVGSALPNTWAKKPT